MYLKRESYILIKIIGLIFLVSFFVSSARAQEVRSTQPDVNQKVFDLERNNQILQEDFARLQTNLDNLESNHQRLLNDFKSYEPVLRGWQAILWLLGATTLIGTAFSVWFMLIKFPKTVNEKVNKAIESVLADRRDQFIALLKEYDFEQAVKKKYQLVLLTHEKGSDSYHYDSLKQNGLNVRPLTTLEKLSDAQFDEGDILIINNDGGHWKADEVQEFVQSNSNVCFYIGRGIIETKGEAANRFAASNFRAQFIGNLINVLKYI